MADLSDVLNQLVGQVAAIVYPSGTGSPSVCGLPVKIYPGWPVANVLEKDLAAKKVHISIYPLPTERKSTACIGKPWMMTAAPAHTVAMAVAGNVVTLSGAPSTQNLMIQANGNDYTYTMQPNDTLASAATALAALIHGAASAGPSVTVAGAYRLLARVGGFGTAIKETKRQEKQFQIAIWAPTPQVRDAIAKPLDAALSDSINIFFSDGSDGTIRYSHTNQSDKDEKAGLYRRDLIYSVDYATTQVMQAAEVIAPALNASNGQPGQPTISRNY